MTPKEENYTGADLSGTDGATNRILTLANIYPSEIPILVWVESQLILPSDLTIVHKNALSTITFGIGISNSFEIRVLYYVEEGSISGASVVTPNDFSQIFNDFKRTTSYEVVTISDDGMGNETNDYAAATNVDLIFFKEELRYMFDTQGLLEVGDAYVLVPVSTGIKRYDKFTIGGEKYIIEKVIHRYVLQTAMLDFGVCFKSG